MSTIELLIIDDHPAVRDGLEMILNQFPDIRVVATADSGEAGLELYPTYNPDVVLVDMLMSGMDGAETIAALKRRFPDSRAIALTQSEEDTMVVKAVDAGAIGYLIKTAPVSAIVDAVRAAVAGKRSLSPQAVEALVNARVARTEPQVVSLTDRELRILTLMTDGLRNAEIAERTNITVSTVKFHATEIFKKLGVRTRTEAVVVALQRGLIKPRED